MKPQILLVDNDPHFRESLARDVLELEGYTVFQADSVSTARELLAAHLIHLALVDIRLTNDDNPHDRSGLEFCAELPPTIPRLFLTGYPEWDVVRSALQTHADGYRVADGFLFKGEGPEGVLGEIQRVLQAEFELIPRRRIAVLTSGADSPGMNAAIRAVVRTALEHEIEVIGVQDGFQGLVNDQMIKLTWHDVHDIMLQNGSFLGPNRFPALQSPLVRQQALENLLQKHISGLVVIGGEGSMKGARALGDDLAARSTDFQVIGIPGTIDNDVWGTDLSLGATSVADAMIEDLRHLLHPAAGRRRIYIIEAPGRYCGYLTLQTALGISADAAIIPEQVVEVYPPINAEDSSHWQDRVNIDQTTTNFLRQLAKVACHLEERFATGQRQGFVVLSEGIGQLTGGLLDGAYVRRFLEDRIKQWSTGNRPEVRTHILGFPVRGVPPTRFDIGFGAQLGAAAVQAILDGKSHVLIGHTEDQYINETCFAEVIEKSSHPPKEVWQERPNWIKQLPAQQDLLARPSTLKHPAQTLRNSFEQRARLKYKQVGKHGAGRSDPPTGFFATLNPNEVYTTIHKNSASSFGLTLVAGMPFSNSLAAHIKQAQGQLDHLAPGRFTWYSTDHFHVTLVALIRGRYREGLPVRRSELAVNLQQYLNIFNDALSETQPFTLDFSAPHITPTGSVIVKVTTPEDQTVQQLRTLLALDQPPPALNLHLSIGYLNSPAPLSEVADQERFEAGYEELRHSPLGSVTVQQLWLVHYANRMLHRIIGKLPFTLGQPNVVTVEQMMGQLRLAGG